MKKRVFAYIIIVASGLLIYGCHKKKDTEEQRYSWLTDAPLTIPFKTRIQKIEKANQLRNCSFETGKTFTLDSSTTSFVIDGWQQVGGHIEWVDIRYDSLYEPDEVYSGYRAVKIVRKTASETDDHGEGIISDFVKVIPGNYNLTLYTRLEHVLPLKARLGTRMHDGVVLNLLFFDRNKIPLKPDFRFPQANQVIDVSFKALSFANFKEIRSFGWGKIIGKSNSFPFPEGDIPSDAHYIKIFVGLKGTGTMWIDSINFSYTDRNFSIAERMLPFTDTSFSTPLTIIPTPKKLSKLGSVYFYKPGMRADQLPIIVIPEDADALLMNAARLIQEELLQSIAKQNKSNQAPAEIPITTIEPDLNAMPSRLIFNLGNTSIADRFKEKVPQQDIHPYAQGYFIQSPVDFPNLVILGANSSIGVYYAALSVIQMIDNQLSVFHNAQVLDYPDFGNRFYSIHNEAITRNFNLQKDFARELIKYKFNGAFITSDKEDQPLPNDNLDEYFLSLCGNDLFSLIRMPAFLMPEDSTLTYNFPFRNETYDIAASQVIKSLCPSNTKGTDPFLQIIVPPAFHNQLLDNSIQELVPGTVSGGIKTIYSGSSFFSIQTDDADFERFASTMGAKPVFLDNSMLMATSWGQYNGTSRFYPGKLRLFNIFEPFLNEDIREHLSRIDTSLFLVDLPVHGEIDIIRLGTAADFLWNCQTYSKDYSLWKVLISRYGAENARNLVTYADQYGLMLELLLKLELKSQLSRNFKTGQQVMSDLTSLVAIIGENLGSKHRLVKELQSLNTNLRKRLNAYTTMMSVKK